MVTRYGMSEMSTQEEMPINLVLEEAMKGTIDSIEVYGRDLLVRMKDGIVFRSRKEERFTLVEYLAEQREKHSSNGATPALPPVYVKPAKMLGGLGPRTFGKREELIFLGREITEQRDYSDLVAEQIDQEVQGIILEAYARAQELLQTNKAKLVHIARHLITHETVEGEELKKLFDSEAPPIESLSPEPAPASH
ncbi:MAG: hypothetical protein HY681_14810 [Chloroflexi bacterium]|nr:hypothetical protein [Chloroflexota bacterium]